MFEILSLQSQNEKGTYGLVVSVVSLDDGVQLVDEHSVLLVEPLGPVLLLDAHSELIEPILAIVRFGDELSLFLMV